MMKRRRLHLLVAVCGSLPFTLFAVEPGDTRESVVAELGSPTGIAGVGEKTILFFPHGEVMLRDNRVITVNLISADELVARQAAEAAAIERMEAAANARLAKLEAEGRATYAAKKADPLFLGLPAAEQLSYWRGFASRYPMIPVTAEIAPLAAQVDEELRLQELELAHENRLAEIEARVAAAEERARRAKNESRRVGLPYYGRPIYPRPPDCPSRPPEVSPPLHPMDAARAKAMAEFEAARRRAYNGGVDVPKREPGYRTQNRSAR